MSTRDGETASGRTKFAVQSATVAGLRFGKTESRIEAETSNIQILMPVRQEQLLDLKARVKIYSFDNSACHKQMAVLRRDL